MRPRRLRRGGNQRAQQPSLLHPSAFGESPKYPSAGLCSRERAVLYLVFEAGDSSVAPHQRRRCAASLALHSDRASCRLSARLHAAPQQHPVLALGKHSRLSRQRCWELESQDAQRPAAAAGHPPTGGPMAQPATLNGGSRPAIRSNASASGGSRAAGWQPGEWCPAESGSILRCWCYARLFNEAAPAVSSQCIVSGTAGVAWAASDMLQQQSGAGSRSLRLRQIEAVRRAVAARGGSSPNRVTSMRIS